MKNLVILISDTGKGSNLKAIINAVNEKKIDATIVTVVSDTDKALGLKIAKQHNIPIVINPKKENLLSVLLRYTPDFIVLAGWKQFIIDDVIDAFPNRILNLHPGLVPDTLDGAVKNPDRTDSLWNRGKLATVAIQNFLDHHATFAGSSIHFLTHEFDFGPVLGRTFEKIEPGDTVESLYKRLKEKENTLYVKVLQKLCQNSKVKSQKYK